MALPRPAGVKLNGLKSDDGIFRATTQKSGMASTKWCVQEFAEGAKNRLKIYCNLQRLLRTFEHLVLKNLCFSVVITIEDTFLFFL